MFKDRHQAGVLLANKLQRFKSKKDTYVVAIPRGGVAIGKVISDRLNLPLQVVITKKIGAPNQPELAIGALAPDGSKILDYNLINSLGISDLAVENSVKKATNKVDKYKGKFLRKNKNLKGKTTIIVDDGIATGSTIKVAIKYLRAKGVSKIILVVPVAPKGTKEEFIDLVDKIIILKTPFQFHAVGQFYQDFPQLTDEDVAKMLN